MKNIGLAIITALSLSAPAVAATKVAVQLPVFKSAEEAMSWGQKQISSASKTPGGEQQALLAAAAAFKVARTWKGASAVVQADAALGEAEAFLRAQAPKNALQAIDSVPHATLVESGRMARIKERAGEVGELLGSKESAHQTYEEGLALATAEADSAWRTLLLYRSGVVAVSLGRTQVGAARLEEAAALLGETTQKGVALRASLARCYAKMNDTSRADAWATKSQRGLQRLTPAAAADSLPATFVKEPAKEQLEKHIAETIAMVRR